MSIPADRRYTAEHEWVKEEGETLRVGITDYAQTELGDVVFVEMPEVGRELKKGESFCNVESVKAVSDVYAPLDGTIVAINENLSASPELINASPYEDAWMIELKASDSAQLEELKSSEEYTAYVAELSK